MPASASCHADFRPLRSLMSWLIASAAKSAQSPPVAAASRSANFRVNSVFLSILFPLPRVRGGRRAPVAIGGGGSFQRIESRVPIGPSCPIAFDAVCVQRQRRFDQPPRDGEGGLSVTLPTGPVRFRGPSCQHVQRRRRRGRGHGWASASRCVRSTVAAHARPNGKHPWDSAAGSGPLASGSDHAPVLILNSR